MNTLNSSDVIDVKLMSRSNIICAMDCCEDESLKYTNGRFVYGGFGSITHFYYLLWKDANVIDIELQYRITKLHISIGKHGKLIATQGVSLNGMTQDQAEDKMNSLKK